MIYENQKAILEKDLLELKINASEYFISNLTDYPKDNKHFQVDFPIEIGFNIWYNSDEYVLRFDNKHAITQKENMWAVLSNGELIEDYFEYNKEFENVDNAVKYAYNCYRKELKIKLSEIDDIILTRNKEE